MPPMTRNKLFHTQVPDTHNKLIEMLIHVAMVTYNGIPRNKLYLCMYMCIGYKCLGNRVLHLKTNARYLCIVKLSQTHTWGQ